MLVVYIVSLAVSWTVDKHGHAASAQAAERRSWQESDGVVSVGG